MILHENSETVKERKIVLWVSVFLRDVTSDDVIVELQMKDKNMSNLQENLKAVHSLFNTQYVSSFYRLSI